MLLVIGAFVIHAVVKFTYKIHMFDINSKIETNNQFWKYENFYSYFSTKITLLIIILYERVSDCCLTPIPSDGCSNSV